MSSLGSMLQTLVALAIVLGALGGLAWVLKRLAGPRAGGAGQFRIIATQALGPRERLVLVEFEQQWLLLGVTAQSINTLQTMPARALPPGAPAPLGGGAGAADFARLLARTLQRKDSGGAGGQ